jgi:hypothetical protein
VQRVEKEALPDIGEGLFLPSGFAILGTVLSLSKDVEGEVYCLWLDFTERL